MKRFIGLLLVILSTFADAQIQAQRPSYFTIDTALAPGALPRFKPPGYMMLRSKDSTLMWTSYTGTWHEFSEGANLDSMLESGVRAASQVSILDFLAGFDLDSVSAGRVSISLDYREKPIDLSGFNGAEVANILPARFVGIGLNNTQVDDNISIDQRECGTFYLDRENPATNEGMMSWDASNNRIWVGSESGALQFYPGPHTEGGLDIEEGDVQVIDQALVVDYGLGFDITVTGGIEANIVLDYTEDPVDLSGAEATGILAAARFPALIGDVTTSAGSVTTTIGADKVVEAHLKAVNAAVDEDLLTYESTTGDFEWHTLTELGIVPTARTITINGTTNEISVSGGTQDLSANRTWTVSLPSTLDLSSKVLQGNTLFSVEGSSADANEMTLVVVNPTSDRTITIPNASGTVAVSASSPVSLSSAGQISINANGIGPTQIDETANYTWTGQHDYSGAEILSTNAFRFEGSSNDNIYTIFAITNPTSSNKTITFPNSSGEVSLLAQTIESSEITDLTIVNADISATAAIALSKMASGSAAQMIVLDGSGVQAYVSMSGDATIASGGAITVANDAITYAKLQNVSATQRVFGRNSSGAGDVEEVTLTQLLDWVNSVAQGDLFYRGASSWTRLPAGTSGQLLQTQGTGANPLWATVSTGAATSEPLITHATSTGLSNEKVLTEGNYIDVTFGASDATVAFDPEEVGSVTWGSGSNVDWTVNTTAADDIRLQFRDDELQITTSSSQANSPTLKFVANGDVASYFSMYYLNSAAYFNGSAAAPGAYAFNFVNNAAAGYALVDIDGYLEVTYDVTIDGFLSVDDGVNVLGDGTNPGRLSLYEATTNGGNFISIFAPASLATDYNLTMPSTQGAANTFLENNGSGTLTFSAIDLSTADVTGTLAAARFPALTGDVTTSAGSVATTIAVNAVQGTDIQLASEASGSIMYHNGTDWVVLGIGTNGQVLKIASNIPSWGTDNAGGGSLVIEEGDVSVVATASSLDFGTGLDVSETPSNEANITFDPTEIASVTWAAADGVWTFDATSGTNPTLAWSDNQFKVAAILNIDAHGASAGQGGQLRLEELATNGSNYVAWRAPDALSGDFIFRTPDGYGTNNYVLHTDGAGNTFWDTDDGAGGGAPVDAAYIVSSLNGTLTNERVANGTANEITIADGGANGNFVFSLANLLTLSTKELQGNTLFRAEGATADEFEATFTVANFTDDQSILFPNNSGTVVVAATSPLAVSATGVVSIAITDGDVPNTITLDNLTQITTRNHTDLQGLTTTDAGHTQFVMLAGRSGGQNVRGGTAASENLILESTANASKGFIQIEDKMYFPDVTTVFEFEGSSADANETVIVVANPTADHTATLPNASGEFSLLGQTIETGEITNGTILGEDISESAGITITKMFPGSSGQIIVLDGSGMQSYVTMSGDATIATNGTLTITTNAVQGTDISLASEATGSIMYFDGTNWVHLGIGASGTVLKSNGTLPTWDTDLNSGGGGSLNVEEGDATVVGGASAIDFGAGFDVTNSPAGEANIVLDLTEKQVVLTTEVTGILPVSNGGTGNSSFTANGVVLGNSTNALSVTAAGSASQIFGVPDGGGAPVFRSLPLHASTHQDGGSDEVSVTGLSGLLADAQKMSVRANEGTPIVRQQINFINGAGISITADDDAGTPEIDVTIATSGIALSTDPFILMSNSANLNNERALAGTSGEVTLTDGGANSSLTISLPTLLTLSTKELQGGTLFLAEGATANDFEATYAQADVSADRNYMFPDASGEVSLLGQTIQSAEIADGEIVNADISASAAIALSKLANGTSAQIIVANGVGVWTNVTASGDVLFSNAGVTTIQENAVDGSDLQLSGEVTNRMMYYDGGDWSVTNTPTSGNIIVANATGVPTFLAASGDMTISNAGVVTIANDAVTYAKLQNVTDNRLLGRSVGSSGDAMEISVGSGLTLSGGTLSATSGGNITVREVDGSPSVSTAIAEFDNSDGFVVSSNAGAGKVDLANVPIARLATFTSAELAAQLTNETGSASGVAVFNDNPTLAGATLSAALLLSDGSGDSPNVRFTPQFGPSWDVYTEDSSDDLIIGINTGNTENVSVFNFGAGVTNFSVDGYISGNNLSGTNTGDQTITLTGDVIGSGTGSFAATIANDAVTFAKMQNITDNRLLGRSAGSSGDAMEITIGAGLTLSGGALTRSVADVIIVAEVDGTPSVSAGTLKFDQADGFTVTDMGGGIVQIDLPDFEEEAHASEHQDGGADEISVTGLSGLLADAQRSSVGEFGGTPFTAFNIYFESADGFDVFQDLTNARVRLFLTNLIDTDDIINGSVLYGDIQDISTTQRFLGRNSAGGGPIQEVTITQALDWLSSTQGTVPYRGASAWAVASAGSNNQVFRISDGGGNPAFGALNLGAAAAVTGNLPLENLGLGSSAQIMVANGSGIWTNVAMSGDATIAISGAIDLANNSVDGTEIALSSQSTGALMHYDGTDWVVIPPGTNGYILKMVSGVPTWVDPNP